MGTLRRIKIEFQQAVAAYDDTLQSVIEDTKDAIPDYVRTQLYSGITGANVKITPKYFSDDYAGIKFKENRLPGYKTPDLYLYGDFYNGIGVVVNRKSFVVSSSDSKAPKLELKYGSEIYGLNAQNKSKYSLQTVKPLLFARIKAQIGG